MRKCVVVVLFLCLTGCTINQQFVSAVDASWSIIGPRYAAYVDADPLLDEDSKATRKRTAQLLTEVIEEAKK